MKIKLLKPIITKTNPRQKGQAGEVVEVDAAFAARLIRKGKAEPVNQPKK